MSVKLRRRKRSGNKESLYLDIYHDGIRKFEHLNLFLTGDKIKNKETLRTAELIRAKREVDLNYEDHGLVSPNRKKENFVKFFEGIVNQLPKDRSSWQCTLVKLKNFTNDFISFNQITSEWLLNFQKYLLSEVSQITAWHYYSNIKFALNKAVRERIINNNPANLIKGIKKPETKREYLTEEEIKTIVSTKCSNLEVKNAFLFSCFTGLRLSDIINLKWENIVNDRIEYTQKKTRSVEYLPLTETAINILKKQKIQVNEKDNFIFHLPVKCNISANIKKWMENSNINKKISFHNARHTFATLSLNVGNDLYTVSKLLGHKDISTTQIYAKIIDSKKQEAVNKLPVINLG